MFYLSIYLSIYLATRPCAGWDQQGGERFSGGFNRVQVAGTDQALVAEDEALRTGVAAPSVAAVLAVGPWDAIALADRHADLVTG